jgi:hypothetical protein
MGNQTSNSLNLNKLNQGVDMTGLMADMSGVNRICLA